jgi:hypothetical protein
MKQLIQIGQVFVCQNTKYLLAQTAYKKVSLINMIEGNRYHEATTVDELTNISEDEWYRITFDKPEDFILKQGY